MSQSKTNVLGALVVLLSGLLIGSLVYQPLNSGSQDLSMEDASTVRLPNGQTCVTVDKLKDDFLATLSEENQFATHEGKTWIPVDGNPVELLILNDPTCGSSCNPTQSIATLKQVFTPAMLVRNVDINSEEGSAIKERFGLKGLPAYVLGDGFSTFTKDGLLALANVQIQAVVQEKEGQYLVDSKKVNFRIGKFIEPPSFDLAEEPRQGNGKVSVIEFTDYQCPYCKRLHDQNKDLIQRLIKEGKITYYMKDFPLGFHADAMLAHRAANCALETGDHEKYWSFHDELFDEQATWSKKGDAINTEFFKTLAQKVDLDGESFASCLADKVGDAEIREDMNEGGEYGVTGTPALFIGTQIMPGAIGPDAFEAAVEAELK